jgi:hypothetical protein
MSAGHGQMRRRGTLASGDRGNALGSLLEGLMEVKDQINRRNKELEKM